MVEEANNNFNTNARLFNKQQLDKLLTELNVEPAKKNTKQKSTQTIKQEPGTPRNMRQSVGSVEEILRTNFIEEDSL